MTIRSTDPDRRDPGFWSFFWSLLRAGLMSPFRLMSWMFGHARERANDPALLLEESLEHMTLEYAQAKSDLADRIVGEQRLAKEIEKLRPEVDRWREAAERHVQRGDDEKARAALNAQRARLEEIQAKEAALENQKSANQTLRVAIEQMGHKLAQAKASRGRLQSQLARGKAASGDADDPFSKFQEIEDKIEEDEIRAQVRRDLDDRSK